MAELPELTILQRQMHEALAGRTVCLVEATQPKCLNVSPDALSSALVGGTIAGVTRRGKWLFLAMPPDRHLLLNLGMGADVWHYPSGGELPGKYQLRMEVEDGTGFTCRFWWFGYVRLLTDDELASHPETSRLGPDPLEIDEAAFIAVARAFPRKPVKAVLLDQDKVSGIGNAYAHDLLWKAKLHPQRRIGDLSNDDLARLHESVRWVMLRALDMGGMETDYYRSGGNLSNWDAFSLVGYKEGKPCPDCGTAITKIKSGATATYICPMCQPG